MAKRRGTSSRGGASARRVGKGASDRAEPTEFQSTSEVRTGLILGNTFSVKAVQYSVVDGLAMFEGDIVLGTEAEVAQKTEQLRAEVALPAGVVITGDQFRWPNCRIPYTIDPALTNQQRVTDAIAHWEQNTPYRFPLRTNETDYITFRPANGCSSPVGRQGGQQFVNTGNGCTAGILIHEIGHVVGLWHEQSREDRDAFVTINWAKIEPGKEHNFNQHISDGDDVGAYDYGSIMHYPRWAFSIDGSDTITPVDPNAQIGQRNGLSQGDIAAANSICPTAPKRPFKDGPKDVVIDTMKEVRKDLRFETTKEMVHDTRKELIKDRIKEVALDPPFGKVAARDPIRPGVGLVQPGPMVGPSFTGPGLPFAVVTPHAAPAAEEQQLEATIVELDAQLSALAQQIAHAEASRDTLQAQYDELAGLLEQSVRAHDPPPTR